MPNYSPPIAQLLDAYGRQKGFQFGGMPAHDYLEGVTSALDLRVKQAVQATPGIAMPSVNETAPTAQLAGNAYYIDSVAGNDANSGVSPAAPWQNITKLNGLNPGNGATIYLAADGVWTYVDTWANYKSHSGSYFPYNCSDSLRSSSAAAPVVVKPYYPRGSSASKPQIAWYSALQSSDFTQVASGGNPGIALNNVWRTPWSGTFNCNGFWVMFNNGAQMSVAAIQQVAGQAYGANGSNPGQLLNPGDIAYDGSYLYVCAPANPVAYFGSVWVTGAYSVFSSFYQGLNCVKFVNIQFNYCSAVTVSNSSTAPVVGLEMEGCVANCGTLLNYNNANTNAAPQMGQCAVHDCTVFNSPYAAVYLSCTGGTAGNTVSWQVYRNRLYGGNLSASFGGALLYTQAPSGTNHAAWQNYCYQARNGTGGNNIDGAGIYCDINSSDSLILGNVFEQCGIGSQGNLSKACLVVANLYVDCIAAHRSTAAAGNNVAGCGYSVQNNTWLWTGRIAPGSLPLSPGSGGLNQPVFQAWNDGFNSYGNKYSYYCLCNNLAIDLTGAFGGGKPMAKYISSQIATLLVAGNAAAGFGAVNVINNNGADATATPGYMSVLGSSLDAAGWLEAPGAGSAKLALDSPLFGMGAPLSVQYVDIKGAAFNNVPTPGCYEQPALRLY